MTDNEDLTGCAWLIAYIIAAWLAMCLIIALTVAAVAAPLRNGYWYVPGEGGNAALSIRTVEAMNKRGNTAVFGRSCSSACAITWNLARKKCLLYGSRIALQQHKRTASGQPVRVHSKSFAYWRKATRGPATPSWELVYFEGSAPRCPDGIKVAGL